MSAQFSSGNKPKRGSRTSVTIPSDHLEMLQVVADGKKVSVAWVIRDAKRYSRLFGFTAYSNRNAHIQHVAQAQSVGV